MVFHRFIEEKRLSIHLGLDPDPLANGPIKPWNPFLPDLSHLLPGEVVRVGDLWCSFKGYVLPHRDRCSEEQWQDAAGPNGWVAQQGFYVYRNHRMVVDGHWLQLDRGWRKDELYKLARIQLDFDSRMDFHWRIDIKKSRASPPPELREKLRGLAMRVRQESERVFTHRGSRHRHEQGAASADAPVPVWHVAGSRDGLHFTINRDHPVLKQFLAESSRLDRLLNLLERTFPAARVWLEMNRQVDPTQHEENLTEAEAQAAVVDLFSYLVESCKLSPLDARRQILASEPFDRYGDSIDALLVGFGAKEA